LDIGVAASPDKAARFLAQRMSWCNLDQRHELAVLALADGSEGSALASSLSKVLNGTAKDVAGIPEAIFAALPGANVAVVIGDGQAHIRHADNGRVYHQRGGRLAQITGNRAVLSSLKLAAGDWLLLIRNGPDATALQTEIAQTSSSAVELAQQLVERRGN